MNEEATPSANIMNVNAPNAPEAQEPAPRRTPRRRPIVPLAIVGAVVAILAVGWVMVRRSAARVNDVAMASGPKAVTVVTAQSAHFRPSKRYVATIEPWLRANVGPQLVSAYVDTVIYRPGAVVKKGDVLATLDCRNATAQSQEVAMAAKALESKEKAIATEAARLEGMLDGGYVSPTAVENKQAEAATQQADILAAKAKLLGTSLEVNDCILKSPFDGEVADRYMDPGAFAHPGSPIASLVDRSTVRIAADVPETDFALVVPGTSMTVKILATGRSITAPVTRRVPSADAATRTVHFEIDVADAARDIPVGTTAEITVSFGEPIEAAEIPLIGAAVRGDKATVYVVEEGVAKKKSVAVLGEAGGSLYLERALVGAKIVSEGRALLEDGDRVAASEDATPTSASSISHGPEKTP